MGLIRLTSIANTAFLLTTPINSTLLLVSFPDSTLEEGEGSGDILGSCKLSILTFAKANQGSTIFM